MSAYAERLSACPLCGHTFGEAEKLRQVCSRCHWPRHGFSCGALITVSDEQVQAAAKALQNFPLYLPVPGQYKAIAAPVDDATALRMAAAALRAAFGMKEG